VVSQEGLVRRRWRGGSPQTCCSRCNDSAPLQRWHAAAAPHAGGERRVNPGPSSRQARAAACTPFRTCTHAHMPYPGCSSSRQGQAPQLLDHAHAVLGIRCARHSSRAAPPAVQSLRVRRSCVHRTTKHGFPDTLTHRPIV